MKPRHGDDIIIQQQTLTGRSPISHSAILAGFAGIEADAVSEPLGQGLINDTFLVRSGSERYVLQRINSQVFAHPEQVMANLQKVLELFAGDGGSLRMPRLMHTRNGDSYLRDEAGEVWRLMSFIDDSQTLQTLQSSAQAAEVGRALAAFHRRLADLDCDALYDTLPGFHVTPSYLAVFDALPVPAADSEELRYCLRMLEQGRPLAPLLQQAQQAGRLRLRVTHGDPKLNNFLFDRQGLRVISLIDLDTVKPGLLHHDIGDCIRSCCNISGEGSDDVRFNKEYCRALLDAWLEGIGDLLNGPERELLVTGILILPWELGLRFLTDHLQGGHYFKTDYPGQNLQRARNQFALYEQMSREEETIRACIGGN